MAATTVAVPSTEPTSRTRAAVVALIALAIVVLVAVSAMLASASTHRLPAIVPAAVQSSPAPCQLGRPC
jgi:hypothetical protein